MQQAWQELRYFSLEKHWRQGSPDGLGGAWWQELGVGSPCRGAAHKFWRKTTKTGITLLNVTSWDVKGKKWRHLWITLWNVARSTQWPSASLLLSDNRNSLPFELFFSFIFFLLLLLSQPYKRPCSSFNTYRIYVQVHSSVGILPFSNICFIS